MQRRLHPPARDRANREGMRGVGAHTLALYRASANAPITARRPARRDVPRGPELAELQLVQRYANSHCPQVHARASRLPSQLYDQHP